MKITSETATVYRGGGRRYFTLAAAVNAEARSKIASRKADCACTYCEHDEVPGCPIEDLPCALHGRNYEKALRRLNKIYMRAYRAQKGSK